MAETVISAEKIAEEAAKAGLEELNKFTDQTYDKYITRFSAHKLRLEKIRINRTVENSKSIDQSLSILARLSTIINIYPSKKGGGNILPEEELNKAQKGIQEQYNNERSKIHEWANKVYSDNEIIKVSLEITRDVYSLRQDVMGTKEQFAFIYRGEGYNVLSVKEVDVTTFLNEILELSDKIFNLTIDDNFMNWGLRFNKSIMNSLLQKDGKFGERKDMKTEQYNSTKKLAKFYRQERDALQEKETTEQDMNSYEKGWKEKNKIGDIAKGISGILRHEDDKYYVTSKKYNSGFISQALYNSYKNKIVYDYVADNKAWFKGGDVTEESTKTEYSVKSFLEGAPSFVSINSLFTVVNEILTGLVAKKSFGAEVAKEFLKSSVFDSSSKVAQAGSDEINNLLNIITG